MANHNHTTPDQGASARRFLNLPPTVTVQTPNGGEVYQAGQVVTITWESFDFDGEVFRHDVRFSADGGTNFSTIATNLTGFAQSFNWTVPATPTSQGRIEVLAYDDLNRIGRDRSNANFSIAGSAASSISSLQPGTITAGQSTQVAVAGTGLATSAAAYSVVTGTGFLVTGVQVLSASGNASNVNLQIAVAPTVAANTYQLRMQGLSGPVMAPLAISAASVQPTLNASPGSQSVVAGNSVNYQIALTPASFGGVVSLSLSGLPNGASAIFSPNPTSNNASTLTISTAPGTAEGARVLTVMASALGVTIAPVTIGLTVQATVQASVALSLSPSAQSVERGQSASYSVALNRSNFFGPVALSVSGLPQGASAFFGQNPVTGNGTTLTVQTTALSALGGATLTLDGNAPGVVIMPGSAGLTVTAGAVEPPPGIALPPGQTLVATRVGSRRNPLTGALQKQVGVLTQGTNANGVRFSLLRVFVDLNSAPAVQVQRSGPNRYTDFRFVDLAGNGNAYLACLTEKSQDEGTTDLSSQVQIVEPQGGMVVQSAVLSSTVRPFGSTQVSSINPDFGGMATLRMGSQEYLMVVPQNSFATIGATVTSTQLHFFRFSNGSVQRSDFTLGERPAGATVQRSMLAAGTFGKLASKSFVVFSKNLLLVFDPLTGQPQAQRMVDIDLLNSDGNDVLNPPGNTQASTPGGRRYGQFRLVDIRGGAGQEILIAAHSLPKTNDAFPLGLQGMYTTLPTIQPGSSGFIEPIWGPPGAPGNSTSRYRFFKDATKKADERNPEQKRFTFLNNALLVGGTPPNGIDDVGDGLVSMLVSDAPPTAVPARTPSIALLDAVSGADKLAAVYPGAVALDALKTPAGPARIVVWGGLQVGQPYASGKLQVLRYDAGQRALVPMARPSGAAFEFEQGHQPVLLSLRSVDTLPEDIGVSSDMLALFLATPVIGATRTFLAFRTGQPGLVDAYDIDTLERAPAGANLDLGPGAQLLAIVDGLALVAAEPVLAGSAFVVRENASDGTQVIRFKRVTPDGRLIAARLA
jgi:hypothetical protein